MQMKKIYLLTLILALTLVTRPTFSDASGTCAQTHNSALTLMQLVQQAEFISLFRATGAVKIKENLFHGISQEPYSYHLVLEANLKGLAPMEISLVGGVPEDDIPAYYFSTLQRHGEIEPNTVTKLGMAWPVKLTGNKGCKYLPSFKENYKYLIFGGVDSQISYELILDSQRDSWIKMVREELHRQKK